MDLLLRRLLLCALFAASFIALPARSQDAPPASGPQKTGSSLRIVNLLAFRGEASLLLDGEPVVSNTVTGDVSLDLPSRPGPHRLTVKPLADPTGKPLLDHSFTQPARGHVTLVLFGGTSGRPGEAASAPPAVIALTPLPPGPAAAQAEMARDDNARKGDEVKSCQLLFLNAAPQGALRIDARANGQAKTFNLQLGQQEVLDPWPTAPLDLQVRSLDPKRATFSAILDLFTPENASTYYCIFYATTANHPVKALYLAAEEGLDLGKQPIDDR